MSAHLSLSPLTFACSQARIPAALNAGAPRPLHPDRRPGEKRGLDLNCGFLPEECSTSLAFQTQSGDIDGQCSSHACLAAPSALEVTACPFHPQDAFAAASQAYDILAGGLPAVQLRLVAVVQCGIPLCSPSTSWRLGLLPPFETFLRPLQSTGRACFLLSDVTPS